jgi:hypothetical protein
LLLSAAFDSLSRMFFELIEYARAEAAFDRVHPITHAARDVNIVRALR